MIPTRITLGIDEAGRGPAIGPMVMAAVTLDTKAARKLTRAGLADSKSYGAGPAARTVRAELAARVRDVAIFATVEVVDVPEIDERVNRGELNVLEREVAARMIDRAPARDRIIADGARMFRPLALRYPELEAFDEGESRHASVAAASVLAKTLRDQLFEQIAARYTAEFGEITGGGYCNDATRKFLRAYAERYDDLPVEARRSWPYPYLRDLLGERCMPVSPQLGLGLELTSSSP
jgi:ribonuclease HII